MKATRPAVLVLYVASRLFVIAAAAAALFSGQLYTAGQCLLTLFLFALPAILERRFAVQLPDTLEMLVILFLFASNFLGEVRDCYGQFPLWDTILHTVSGFLTTAIGMSMIDILNRSERVKFTLAPGFVVLSAFCFSMTSGVVWEFFEFAADTLFHTDMQKDTFVHGITSVTLGGEYIPVESAVLNGEALPGWLDIGLFDTMKDLIANAAGALFFCLFGILYLKSRGSVWITRLLPKWKKADPSSGGGTGSD